MSVLCAPLLRIPSAHPFCAGLELKNPTCRSFFLFCFVYIHLYIIKRCVCLSMGEFDVEMLPLAELQERLTSYSVLSHQLVSWSYLFYRVIKRIKSHLVASLRKLLCIISIISVLELYIYIRTSLFILELLYLY